MKNISIGLSFNVPEKVFNDPKVREYLDREWAKIMSDFEEEIKTDLKEGNLSEEQMPLILQQNLENLKCFIKFQ